MLWFCCEYSWVRYAVHKTLLSRQTKFGYGAYCQHPSTSSTQMHSLTRSEGHPF